LNNRAVELVGGGFWQEGQSMIAEAAAQAPEEPSVIWNKLLIDLKAEALGSQLYPDAYPLISYVFYGDYPTALDLMRPYTPAEIFSQSSPLIVNTMAAGWEETLHDWLIMSTDAAISVKPDLAEAYFLRAWALYLVDPTDPEILSNVRQAAELAPNEPLYSESVSYLEGSGEPTADTGEDRFELVGLTQAQVDELLMKLKVMIAAGDAEGMAELIAYPLEVKLNGQPTTIDTPEAFAKNYRQILTEPVIQAIANQQVDDLFVNWQGIMIGDGQVWLNGVYPNDDLSQPVEARIIAINN
jgi:hypothetical protein